VHEVVAPNDGEEPCREHRDEPESDHFHLWPQIVAFATLSTAVVAESITRLGGSDGGH
jgi:hypothetical protein